MATTSHADSISPQPPHGNGALRPPKNRRRQPPMDYEDDGEYIPRDPGVSRTRSVSYRNNPPAPQGHCASRSYSSRAKDTHRDAASNWMDKPLPPEPSVSADGNDTPRGSFSEISTAGPSSAMHYGGPYQASSPSNSQQSSINRSATINSTSDQRDDWAADRSPLQKLEVALNGISKEEKRARVQEAERRLKERMARRKPVPPSAQPARDTSVREDPSIRAGPSQRRAPEQPSIPPEYDAQDVRRPDHRRFASEGADGMDLQRRPSERAKPAHSRAPSLPYSAAPPVEPPQYPQDKPGVPVMTTGSVPRRAVSVSHRPGPMNQNPYRDSRFPRNAPVPQVNTSRGPPEQVSNQGWGQTPNVNPLPNQGRPVSQSVKRKDLSKMGVTPQQVEMNNRHSGNAAPYGPTPGGFNSNRGMDEAGPIPPQNIDNESNFQSKPKRQTVSFNVPPPTPPPLSEWKTAPIARLGASDFDFQDIDAERSKAWWEGGGRNRRRSRALPVNYQKPPPPKVSSSQRFQPPIFLKSGPLLRYAGLKRVRIDGPNGPFDKETWRGSILIVTKDSRSTYEPAPTMRVFSQPMDILPSPPVVVSGVDAQLSPEYVDPTAGLMKLGRDGRPLFVKPVDHTEEDVDLSFVENDDGIYEMSASMIDYSSEGIKQPIPANRVHSVDGETVGIYKDISGARLYADPGRDVTFWRFNIEVELGKTQQRVAYRLNQGPALGFWVPARGQSMNVMFHTCNGFSPGVDSNRFCGPDPMWRDVLNEHQTRPFHVMLGGGDQIFNDKITAESSHFREWVKIKNVHDKYDAPFSADFKAELETSFLEHYSSWFSQGLFSLANSQIPMVNMWNDHEILEGFGSYPDEFMGTPVMSGLGNIAFKYYLLFQHHSVPEETEAEEPSWLLGAQPGPYINQRSRHLFMSLGDGMALLGLDCRTERMNDEIISEQTCDLIWDRCHREIVRGETKHLIVMLSIPLAYPRVAMVKNILNSKKSLGKAGIFGGLVNKSGGKVEIFDDHWTAKHHKSERTYLIEDLQDLAADKSVRVTIMSGDVHLAAIGEFYSNPKLNVPKDKDYRYMPNIISSAMADMPETELISDTLNRRNRVHHLDTNTDEDMISIFTEDVNSKPRNNKRLLPRRNWCSIRQYQPGSTPPETPETATPPSLPVERPRTGNKLQRTLSLTRGDRPKSSGGGLLRRLSQRERGPPTKEFNLGGHPSGRRMSMDGPFPPTEAENSYFPQPAEFRPGPFLRRPTNLSQKASKKAADGAGAYLNLEGGLAITLNMELNPRDPSGITAPYKLLVPMLRYGGNEYDPPAAPITKGWRKWLGVRRKKEERRPSAEDTDAEVGMSDEEIGDEEDDDDYEDSGGYGRSAGRDPERSGMPPESLVPVGGGGPDEEEYYDGGREVPKRKKWFGRM